MSTEAATEFDRATAVAPLGDGAWGGVCDPGWWAGRGPNGGYLAAIVLRAMIAELCDPAREPRALTCHYLRPPADGPVRVDVTVERAGRAMATLTARVRQDGRDCLLALAAFGIDVPAPAEFATAPPAVPPPEDIGPVRPAGSGLSIVERFEARPALGAGMLAGAGEALAGGWLRFADPRATDAVALAMFSDAWFPSPWVRLREPVPAPTIDLTVHFRAPAAAAALAPGEPVLAAFRSTTATGGFFEEDGQVWSRDGVLLAQSRQLALLAPLERAAA
ncbi:MAG TPA: thioesterase family protein [Solirubrobacteraceae bacterium]|nr:thioesterase family protein [Solirubrobacteraceae bacterium]